MDLDPKFIARLACPACRGEITAEADDLRCTACNRRYPVRDGIPVLLESESRTDD